MTYLKPCQCRQIVSSIDLISPLEKYSLILSHLDLKSTPNHGNSIPLPPTTTMRGDGNFHKFPWVWRLSVQLEIICVKHIPKTSIFGHLRIKADQLTWGEGYGRAIGLSEGQGHMPYMENHVLLEVKVDHLTTLAQATVSFILISTLHEATTNLWHSYSDLVYFKIK